MNHRSIAYFLLRLTLGFVFLMYGISKIGRGVSNFAEGLESQFAATFLPSILVSMFGTVLPFLEALVGLLLVLGLFTRFATALAGLIMVALTTGLTLLGNPEGVAHNLIYAFIIFGLSYYVENNRLSLDTVRTSRKIVPIEFEHRKTA